MPATQAHDFTASTSITAGTSLSAKAHHPPGETIQFETKDASSGQLSRPRRRPTSPSSSCVRQPGHRAGLRRWRQARRCTQGHRAVLQAIGLGWTGNHSGLRPAGRPVPEARLHHWNYDPGLKPAIRAGRQGAAPAFPGTIGVAPAAPGLHSIVPPRNVAATWTCATSSRASSSGCRRVEGALFSVGDTHAAQGDGEVCGTAIESPSTWR